MKKPTKKPVAGTKQAPKKVSKTVVKKTANYPDELVTIEKTAGYGDEAVHANVRSQPPSGMSTVGVSLGVTVGVPGSYSSVRVDVSYQRNVPDDEESRAAATTELADAVRAELEDQAEQLLKLWE